MNNELKPYSTFENITLYNDSCLEVMKNMEESSIDLIVTDPPYLVTAKGCAGTMGGYWKEKSANCGKIFEHNNISCSLYLPQFYRILKDGTHCYIMINHINLIEMLNVATGCGFKFVKSLIWNKGNKICGRFYMNCFEYILMFRKGKARNINNFSTPDILTVPISKLKDENGKNLHDTEKPVQLMSILIENSSNENETVFQPFAGIGSTLIAGHQLKRKVIGCEIDEKYCEVIVKRLKDKDNELQEKLF